MTATKTQRVTSKPLAGLALVCLTVAACAPQTPVDTGTAAPSTAAATAGPTGQNDKPDIVAPGSGIALGTGWYGYEKYANETFRWVNDDARVVVRSTSAGKKTISFDLEAGPGIGKPSFVLHFRDKSGSEVASTNVVGHERVSFNVPVSANAASTFELHADGGGKPTPHENRILNFRVFAIDDKPAAVVAAADIVSGDVALGKNWGVLEQYQGQTFRWVANDAVIVIAAATAGSRTITLDAASGPAVVSPSDFSLALQDASGKTLQTQHIKAIGSASFVVALAKGANTFRLHVTSTGLSAKTDKRVLSFRVFKIH